jgi:hypothetical protein
MHSGTLRLVVLVCVGVFLGACDADRSLGPDDQVPSAAAVSSGLTASSYTIDAVYLGWPDNSRSESGYEVHRSTTGTSGAFTLLATVGENVTGHSDTGLQPKTEYCYKVRSFKANSTKRIYGGFSNTACATTQGEPPAPTEISAKPYTATSVATYWSDNSMVETGFRLETSPAADGPWSPVATLDANRPSYVHEGRTAEQALCYRVIAFNTVGDSPPSPVKCTAIPARPTDLTTKSVDAQTIDVGWKDNSSFEDGYELQRSPGNEWWSTGPWSVVATLPAGAESYRDAGLTTNTRYWYQVRALKDGGITAVSVEVSGVPLGGPPPAPSSVSAYADSSFVSVRWMSSGPSAEEYYVERSNDGVSGWVRIATVTSREGMGVGDPDRPLEQQVCYRVIAFNQPFGESPPSTTGCTTPLAPPADFAASPAGNGAIDLTWKDVSRANTEYTVEILRVYYGGYYGYYEWWEYLTTVSSGDATSHRVTGLDAYNVHWFRLFARSSGAVSDSTNRAGSLTEAPPQAPSNLSATAISPEQIELVWSDNASDESYFDIDRCDGTADFCLSNDYFTTVRSVGPNTTSYVDAGLPAGSTFTYRVRAMKGGASSTPSNAADATTHQSSPE